MPIKKPNWTVISIIVSIVLAIAAAWATSIYASGGLHARMTLNEAVDAASALRCDKHYESLHTKMDKMSDEFRYLSSMVKLHLKPKGVSPEAKGIVPENISIEGEEHAKNKDETLRPGHSSYIPGDNFDDWLQ